MYIINELVKGWDALLKNYFKLLNSLKGSQESGEKYTGATSKKKHN